MFDTLRNHGHLFSLPLWEKVFESVLFPIFDYVRHSIDPSGEDESADQGSSGGEVDELDHDAWLYETCTLALQLVVDLFVKFYTTVNPLLEKVLMLLVSFIKRPHQSLAGIGIAAFVRLMSDADGLFSEEKWLEVVSALKEAAKTTCPDFSYFLSEEYVARSQRSALNIQNSNAESAAPTATDGNEESQRTATHLYAAISDAKCRAAVQLLLIQVSSSQALHLCIIIMCVPSNEPTTFIFFNQMFFCKLITQKANANRRRNLGVFSVYNLPKKKK